MAYTTRVRVGLEWLMTPMMLFQNYHLVHHLHPAVPREALAQHPPVLF